MKCTFIAMLIGFLLRSGMSSAAQDINAYKKTLQDMFTRAHRQFKRECMEGLSPERIVYQEAMLKAFDTIVQQIGSAQTTNEFNHAQQEFLNQAKRAQDALHQNSNALQQDSLEDKIT